MAKNPEELTPEQAQSLLLDYLIAVLQWSRIFYKPIPQEDQVLLGKQLDQARDALLEKLCSTTLESDLDKPLPRSSNT